MPTPELPSLDDGLDEALRECAFTSPAVVIWQALQREGGRPTVGAICRLFRDSGLRIEPDSVRSTLRYAQIYGSTVVRETYAPDGWHEIDLDLLRPSPGVYALLCGDRVLYIGSSGNLRERLKPSCHKHVVGSDRIKVRYTNPRNYEHLAVEARLIRRLRPQFNVRGVRV